MTPTLLTPLLRTLRDDLHARIDTSPDLSARLRADHTALRTAGRSAESFTDFREDTVQQAAAAWVLSCTFLRFLEDNGWLAEPFLSGDHHRRQLAAERRIAFFEAQPTASDTDYLLHAFSTLATLPGGELFAPHRNPAFHLPLSADGARTTWEFFRAIDPDTDALRRPFTHPPHDTRFLGDLYQDLSEHARKRYALLQTPEFVEEFLLDHSLSPAIDRFGPTTVTLIDPTCGSGHLLLGCFHRLTRILLDTQPARSRTDIVHDVLARIHGIDLNPFAVAIARFRLLIAALHTIHPEHPTPLDAPNTPHIQPRVFTGDALLHGHRHERFATSTTEENRNTHIDRYRWDADTWKPEDPEAHTTLNRQYHVVVGNPPYITVKDKALNATYRRHYASCHRKYALVCPFLERFFDLALPGDHGPGSQEGQLTFDQDVRRHPDEAGFIAGIVANSFMKREFGAKLVTEILPHLDLHRVIDTSGAYIPGHGTPTVILTGRNREPVTSTVRAVLGIRGEPSAPDNPRQGLVWSSIAAHADEPGYQDDFISVDDIPRAMLHEHPWTLRGGGALKAKEVMEQADTVRLGDLTDIGVGGMSNADDVLLRDEATMARTSVPTEAHRPLVTGEDVRDYTVAPRTHAIFPYGENLDLLPEQSFAQLLWPWRINMASRAVFGGGTYAEAGRPWWEWHQVTKSRYRTPLTITFAEVATHNHFVLDRGGKVFNRTAPVIKLPADATEDDHLGLLGLLNSSAGEFWVKMVCMNKGLRGEGGGFTPDSWERFYQRDSTKLKQFPLPADRPLELARRLDTLARERAALEPATLHAHASPDPATLDDARTRSAALRGRMIALQEELDWACYGLYGLGDVSSCCAPAHRWDSLPEVALGQRPFEIVLARKVQRGLLQTAWFERHGSTPITEIPAHWPTWYRDLMQARLDAIEGQRYVRLIEDPEFKRRWSEDAWEDRERAALRSWMLDQLEGPAYWPQADRTDTAAALDPRLTPLRDLSDAAERDSAFVVAAERYAGERGADVAKVVETLVLSEAVPMHPADVYKPSGLRKREEWLKVWALQRREDTIDARTQLPSDHPDHLTAAAAADLKAREVGDIPVPPTYTSADFQRDYQRHRGKLDVPRERFLLLPDANPTPESGPLLGWAGWDHAQRARALAAHYTDLQDLHGWTRPQLRPLLDILADLVPWVKHWHNTPDPHGTRLGDFLEGFVAGES